MTDKRLVLSLAAIVLVVGLLAIWTGTTYAARHKWRECTLLLQEGVTTKGEITWTGDWYLNRDEFKEYPIIRFAQHLNNRIIRN